MVRMLLAAAAVLIALAMMMWWPGAGVEPIATDASNPLQSRPQAAFGIDDLGLEFTRLDVQLEPTTVSGNSAAVASEQPLPDPQLPLHEQLAGLQAAAERGQAEAVCRLALAEQRCRHGGEQRAMQKKMEAALVAGQTSGSEEMLIDALVSADAASQDGFCAGIEEPDTLASWEERLASALGRLSVRQKVLLTLAAGSGSLRRVTPVDGSAAPMLLSTRSLLPQWVSDYSLEFLQAGLAAHDPLALEGMILLHMPGGHPLQLAAVSLRLPDRQRFAGYAGVYLALFGESALEPSLHEMLRQVEAEMPPERWQQLQQRVEREAHRWREALARASRSLPAGRALDLGLCAE